MITITDSGNQKVITSRVRVALQYNGVDVSRDLAPFLLAFSYTDHAGSEADDISLTLTGLDALWGGSWEPGLADRISAKLVAYDWNFRGEQISLPCGTFQIDEVTVDGPPNQVTIRAVSAPIGSGLKRKTKYKAWLKSSLKMICEDIAGAAGLTLIYDAPTNPVYERTDQQQQTDMAYLRGLCANFGMLLKVTDKQLIVYDEKHYEESKAPVFTIDKKVTAFSNYRFGLKLADAYKDCSVSYHDAKKGTVKASFAPDNPLPGETLEINQRVENVAQAQLLAKAKLREKNRGARTAAFTLPFNPHIVGSVTVTMTNWAARYNGVYMVDSVTHAVGQSGSSSSFDSHRVLGY